MINPFDLALPVVKADEGLELEPYLDSLGVLTVGYGTNITQIDEREAEWLLEHRLGKAFAACQRAFPWFPQLTPVRQAVVLMMAYQLGLPRLLGFKRMLAAMPAAIASGDYSVVEFEMLDSKWAKSDSPARARRHARAMRTGLL
jgi:lysozyme